MGREILFRAKRIDNEEWVEGCLLIDYVSVKYFIHASGNSVNESDKVNEDGCLKFFSFEIDPKTVCQYTGLIDETEKKIYEGDIIAYIDTYSTESGYAESDCVGKVVWDDEEVCFHVTGRLSAESWEILQNCGVIGNIFDDPELIED